MTNRNIFFYLALSLWIFTIFLTNYNHLSQEDVFYKINLEAAENIVSYANYHYALFGDTNVFYPLWGYSLLLSIGVLIGYPITFVLALQAILTFVMIFFFYKEFRIQAKYFHLILFLPAIAIMSVKWADSISTFLIFMYVIQLIKAFKNDETKNYIYAAIFMGLLLNFRSEYLLLLLLSALLIVLGGGKIRFTRLGIFPIPSYTKQSGKFNASQYFQRIKLFLVFVSIALIFLLPWAVRSYQITGKPILTATNGGAVAYISLGQLPGNKWQIESSDSTAFRMAESAGFVSAYSPKANEYFQKEFDSAVREYPLEYIKKVSYNFIRTFWGGLYTGEYSNFFIGKEAKRNFENEINNISGIANKLNFLNSQPNTLKLAIGFEKVLRFLSIPLLLGLFIISFLSLFYNKIDKNLTLIFWLVILHKLLVVGLIQYEYRHINSIFLFLLAFSLLYFESKKKSS